MADGVLFTHDAARRIAAAVLNIEHNAPGSVDRELPEGGERGFFRARITGWNPDKPWQLSWVAQQRKPGVAVDPETFDPDTVDATLWQDDAGGFSGSWADNRYAWHPTAAPPIRSMVTLEPYNPTAELSKRCYIIVRPEQTTFVAKIVGRGPNDEADYTDGRYWVREQTVTFDGSGRPGYADATGGRHVVAFNLEESGLGTYGIHGCLFKTGETPSRASTLTAPDRFVAVGMIGTRFVFRSMPFVLIPDSYYLDVYGVDAQGCPDEYKWWKGILPFAVMEFDEPPP